MSRRISTKKRIPVQDPLFNFYSISLLANKILKHGKKTIAFSLIEETFEFIYKKTNRNPLRVLETAIKNVQPRVQVKSTRRGGSTYQVPREVKPFRSLNLALRWIVEAARKKPGKHFSVKLGSELIDASNGTGGAFKKKQEMHKMAKANKAFAHFKY